MVGVPVADSAAMRAADIDDEAGVKQSEITNANDSSIVYESRCMIEFV